MTRAATAMVAGILLSGPLSLLIVGLVHPQPPWTGVARFAAEYHPVQLLPYAGGFLLLVGCVALVTSLHALAPPAERSRTTFAVALTAAFSALILLNYIVQTTFIPALITPAPAFDPAQAPLVAALTMSNPTSLAWALEMWGYAVLGVATWAIATVFGRSPIERACRATFRLNGLMSVAGGVATAVAPGWVLTTPGILAFSAWNLLMVVMGLLVVGAMRARRAR